jgi:hypothetical protein
MKTSTAKWLGAMAIAILLSFLAGVTHQAIKSKQECAALVQEYADKRLRLIQEQYDQAIEAARDKVAQAERAAKEAQGKEKVRTIIKRIKDRNRPECTVPAEDISDINEAGK